MFSTLGKTAIAATTLIIGLAPIATADLAFARGGGGGGGIHMGGGGGGHFGGGLAGRAREGGFHRDFGRFGANRRLEVPLFGGYYAYCGGPNSYPYPPYGPYDYNYCY